METLDERILEHLADEGWATARTMARCPGFETSESRLAERCHVLAHADLIAPLMDCRRADVWELTGRGVRYLRGEVDAESIRPLPKVRPSGAVRPLQW